MGYWNPGWIGFSTRQKDTDAKDRITESCPHQVFVTDAPFGPRRVECNLLGNACDINICTLFLHEFFPQCRER